jgi:hypothetical protein
MIGIAFEVAEVMLERTPHDMAAATDFATRLVMGGISSAHFA